jgi:hypothetical protein
MEFANKMLLVPAGRPDPNVKKMSQLDRQMEAILKNKKLSNFEKMKLYNQVLQSNLDLEKRFVSSFRKKRQDNKQQGHFTFKAELPKNSITPQPQVNQSINLPDYTTVAKIHENSPNTGMVHFDDDDLFDDEVSNDGMEISLNYPLDRRMFQEPEPVQKKTREKPEPVKIPRERGRRKNKPSELEGVTNIKDVILTRLSRKLKEEKEGEKKEQRKKTQDSFRKTIDPSRILDQSGTGKKRINWLKFKRN